MNPQDRPKGQEKIDVQEAKICVYVFSAIIAGAREVVEWRIKCLSYM